MGTTLRSVRWARGRLIEPQVADEMLSLISKLIQEASNQQQPGRFARHINYVTDIIFQ